MADIFISYAREDWDWVSNFVFDLEQQGWSVFWDTDIRTGENWRKVIFEELKAAACTIVVWSRSSIESEWVINEASYSLTNGSLLPLRRHDVDPPFGFQHIQCADFTSWDGGRESDQVNALIADVSRIVPKPPPPPPPSPAEDESPPPLDEPGTVQIDEKKEKMSVQESSDRPTGPVGRGKKLESGQPLSPKANLAKTINPSVLESGKDADETLLEGPSNFLRINRAAARVFVWLFIAAGALLAIGYGVAFFEMWQDGSFERLDRLVGNPP